MSSMRSASSNTRTSNVAQVQPRVMDVVQQSPRRGGDDRRTGTQRLPLGTECHATVHGRPLQRCVAGQLHHLAVYLDSEFARRRQHQGARLAHRPGQQAVQRRQQEGSRLAGSGGCTCDQVAPLEGRRDRLRLNGCGGRILLIEHTLLEVGMNLKLFKCHS